MTHVCVYLIDSGGLFSAAERRELTAMLDGLTVDQAACKHFVSPDTVKSHRTALRQKTGQRSTAGVISYCIATGLVKVVSAAEASHHEAECIQNLALTVPEQRSVGGHHYGLY